MKHIGIVKADNLIRGINWIGVPLFTIYLFCMFILPPIKGKGDWGYIQSVWHNWQSLNVGMLAFISSVVAFNISRYIANKQRNRDFIASRAFLPEALSDLTAYFKDSVPPLQEAWQKAKDDEAPYKTPLKLHAPNPPDGYKETFSRCIALAETDVGERLSYLLMCLQIHHARLNDLASNFSEGSGRIIVPRNIISYLYNLAELQALTNSLFDFARGLEKFDSSELTLGDWQNAYRNLNIWTHQFEGLDEFTQENIGRNYTNDNT